MKANLSPNLALKLAPNENYFTEELVGILWIEFKLFISNWKRFCLFLPLLKAKKTRSFFTSLTQNLLMKANLSANLTLNNLNSAHKIPTSSPVKYFSLGDNFKAKFISYQSLNEWYAVRVVRMGKLVKSADFSLDRSGVQFPMMSGQMATLVGRVATPVIPASGTQPVDQGWGKNYGIAKG